MDKWIVKKMDTADALIAAMELGICRTEEDVERIAARNGDSVQWIRGKKVSTNGEKYTVYTQRQRSVCLA